MGKTVGRIAAIAGFAALTFIPGIGQALQGALIAGSFAAATVVPTLLAIAYLGVGALAAGALQGLMKPKVPGANLSRLNMSFDPNTTRKTVFGGPSAMPADVLHV